MLPKKLSSTDFLILNAGIVINIKTNTKVGHYEKRTKKRQTGIQEESGKPKHVFLDDCYKPNKNYQT